MTKPLTRSGTPHATVSVLCPLIESMMYDLIISAKGIKLHRRSYATNKDMTLRETVRKKNMTAYTDSDTAKFFSSRNLATLRSMQGAKLLLVRIRLPYL